MFSKRTAHDATVNALSRARERAGNTVLDLTVSNPTRAGIPYAREAIVSAFANPDMLSYEPLPFGLPSARHAVSHDYAQNGVAIDPSRIVLTASTSEAYAILFKLLCDPGESILVPQPSYPLFAHLAAFESVRLVSYPLVYDGAWHIDLDALRAKIDRTTRAIILVTPNNPTGSYVKKSELAAIAALGLPIVSDEVFARYPLDARSDRAVTALEAADMAPLVFAMGGLSKLAALPQMKLAWTAVAGERSYVDAALARLELICDSFLSVGTPVQHALPMLLASRSIAENAIRNRCKTNLAYARSIVRDSPLTILDVEGGWYATLRLPRTNSEESWAIEMIEQDAVYIHPGHFFDFADEAFAIASLLTPEDTFAEGMRRIDARVRLKA